MAALDTARGMALLAMAVYHFAWDLGFTGLISVNVADMPAWRIFARAIAASFLVLVGVSLVLATRDGLRPRPFLRRLGLIAGSALAITLATAVLTPDAYVFFGILHCIALSSVLALPFLRGPLWAAMAGAAFCFAAPWFLAHPVFDSPALQWLGLVTAPPRSNDYVPVFPWFGMVLTGVAAARMVLGMRASECFAHWRPHGLAGRGLAWAGRHSLAVYLVHQPLLLGLLTLAALALPPAGRPGADAEFDLSCRAACSARGSGEAPCIAACACIADGLRAKGLWRDVLGERLDSSEEEDVAALAGQCRAGAGIARED